MMQTHLYLYALNEKYIQWILISQGERQPCMTGNWDNLSEYLTNEGILQPIVTLVLPGNRASYVTTTLSSQQLKYVNKALPFALEEKSSQDPSELHIVIANKDKSGQVTAWLIEKSILNNLKSHLDDLNCAVRHCFVDTDLISTDNNCSMLVTAEKHILVSYNGIRNYGNMDWLSLLSEQFSVEGNIQLFCSESLKDADIISSQISSQFDQDVEQSQYSDETFDALLSFLIQKQTGRTDLWVGEYAPVSSNPKLISRAKFGATLLSLFVFIFIAYQLVQTKRFNTQSEAYNLANITICKDIYGPQKQCRLTFLKREVTSLLNRKVNSPAQTGLLSNLDTIGQSLTADMTMDSMRYDQSRSELQLTLRAADFQQLEQFRDQIAESGLKIELSASQQSNYTRGNINIQLMESRQ